MVIPMKSPHPCHYTIRAHCFQFVYRPILTSWKSPYHSHRVLNHKSRLNLNFHQPDPSISSLKPLFFFAHLHIASSHSPCPQPSLLCHFGQSRARLCSPADPHSRLTFFYLLDRMEREWYWGVGDDTNSSWVQWKLDWSVSIATGLHCHLVDRGRRSTPESTQ